MILEVIWMIITRVYAENFWANLDKYVDEKYIIDDGKQHFVRNRKTTQKSIMKYPLYNHGRTTAVEAIDFIRKEKKDKNMTITKSDISQRRKLLQHLCYVDMIEDFIDGIYNDSERPGTFKGCSIFACDTSVCDAPNIGYTEKQLKELNNPHLNRLKKELIRFRASCIADAQTDLILTAEIVNSKKETEIELAMKHLDNLNQRIDMTNTITTYDRGYASLELMLKHMSINSYFLIRIRSDDFQKDKKYMKTNDEFINININSNRTQNFHNEELKKEALKNRSTKIRITEIELINKYGQPYIERLASNLPLDKFSTNDLKELYNKRWKIETNFDRLKNIIHIENFSGYREEIIKQDFYANIFMFNFLMLMKLDADQRIQEKHKNKNLKHEYQANLNVLYGLIKLDMPDLLSQNPKERQDAVNRILKIAESNMVVKNEGIDRNPERIVKDPTNKYPPGQKRGE